MCENKLEKYLRNEILNKCNFVTYKSLSFFMDIHVNHAKKVMYSFYQDNKKILNASYIITGKKGDANLILLVKNESDLENECKKFDLIHCLQIYHLSKLNIHLDLNNTIQNEKVNLNNIFSYQKNGMIVDLSINKKKIENNASFKNEIDFSLNCKSKNSNSENNENIDLFLHSDLNCMSQSSYHENQSKDSLLNNVKKNDFFKIKLPLTENPDPIKKENLKSLPVIASTKSDFNSSEIQKKKVLKKNQQSSLMSFFLSK